ncbi:MAG: putative membrane protein, partial [Planctomycetota bacterium]
AEKCHFCAHRTEIGLAPACAVVCPTEAIIPGDFDDPESRVSQLRDGGGLEARKPEAGTQPNVLYREVAEAGIDPSLTNLSSGFIWSQNPTGERLQVQAFEQAQAQDDLARTVYDVPRERLWGSKITGYLFFKSISAGAFPVAFVAWLAAGSPDASQGMPAGLPAVVAMLGLLITSALLVADLKRPSRFWMILVRPNMKSWLARGTFVLAGYGALLSLWLLLGLMDVGSGVLRDGILGSVTVFLGIMAAAYTGWLFSQAKGRVLWMKRYYWLELACQALVAGGATLMCLQFVAQFEPEVLLWIRRITLLGLAGEGLLILSEGQRAPKNREAEYARVLSLLHKGPYSTMHHMLVACGVAAPILVLIFAPGAALIASLAILVCLWMREELFVRAGQALPIS